MIAEAIGPFQLIIGFITLVFAATVILSSNPVVSAMALMGTLFTTGLLYFGLGLFFIGAAQILIYAGAISVLFVFIVMLLDFKPLKVRIPGRAAANALGGLAWALMLGALLTAVFKSSILESPVSDAVNEAALASNESQVIALQFLSKYMFPFQLTGLLILASIMGVVLLGRPRKRGGGPVA